MEKVFPNEKPAFLFDDIERSTHTAISADAYRALKAEHGRLEKRLENTNSEFKKFCGEKDAIESERDSLKAMVDKMGTLGTRTESTYQNIIAALLDYIVGNLPNIEKHPSFPSEAKLIETIDDHSQGYKGFPKAICPESSPKPRKPCSTPSSSAIAFPTTAIAVLSWSRDITIGKHVQQLLWRRKHGYRNPEISRCQGPY